MEESSLQERLQQHAKAFDGLLSLIPAKMYYGEDATDQWQRKKQTKEEAKEARRNKLDPNSELNKSVKEVMDEEARKKRKREQMPDGAAEDDWSDVEGVEAEKPRQGMKQKMSKKQKKAAEAELEAAEQERRKEEKKQGKKDRKAERAALREEEAEFNRRTIKGVNKIKLGPRESRTTATEDADTTAAPSQSVEHDEPAEEDADDMDEIDVDGIEAAEQDEVTSQSTPRSPVFDGPADSTGPAASTSTSISSTVGPSEKPKHIKIPEDTTELRARLAAKIQALREARNADRNGKPIRTRQELIEARRSKQEERKAHKKEVRRKAKDEADRVREEALASARNSPGGILSPSVDLEENNFSFGRIAFGDGSQLSHDLSHVLSSGKKKGPQDAKTALAKLENQKKRVQAMDEEKRKDIEDKELWLTAKRRAEGEKVRDDEKMLKKAIKRKDHAKKKSEKEWKDRKEGVAKSIHDRQKKREDNLRKRREEKLSHKAGGKKKNRTGPKKTSSKGRAGFEGSFKVGGKKK